MKITKPWTSPCEPTDEMLADAAAFDASRADRPAKRLKPKQKRSPWVSVKDKLPMESEQVIAHYAGVYHRRLVIFWTDSDGTPHFGFHNEPDGKGSQPATHWHSLPELP